MYVESVPSRNSPPAVLPRESYRDGGKFKKRTLANLSHWPVAKVEALRQVPRGQRAGRAGTGRHHAAQPATRPRLSPPA